MATLTLTVLRCPDAVAPEQRQVHGGDLTLGRGAECDWPLPDPERSLSRKHCTLEFYAGSWRVRDLSSNGTFVNYAAEPIGRDQTQQVLDGDRLRVGSYEIEVRIAAEDHPSGGTSGWSGVAAGAIESPKPRVGRVPLPGLDDLSTDGGARIGSGIGARRAPAPPDNFDVPFEPDAPVADHAGAGAEAFQPRPVVSTGKPLIPDDWDLDLVTAPLTESRASPSADDAIPFASAVAPAFAPVAAPAPVAAATPASASAPATATMPIRPEAPPAAGAPAALEALLAGAEIPAGLVARAAADPDAALRIAGALLRVAVAGVRALLIARGEIKSEFRIERTMLRPANNNPLKFAATDEQALASLLDPRTPALSALQRSIDDLATHQVATLAATQAAARALLDKLAPGPIEQGDKEGGFIPGTREKRLWETYKRAHAKLIEQFDDDFESAFGKAFARAYEQAAERAKD